MKYGKLRTLEKHIQVIDAGAVVNRWRWARKVLEDDELATPAGNLRNKVIDQLVESAARSGYKLNRREIQYRVQFGKTYPTEAHVREVLDLFGSWGEIRDAGFPAVEVPEVPEDALAGTLTDVSAEALARAADSAASLLPAGTRAPLFPERFDEFSSLADLVKYGTEMAELTGRFVRRDQERAEYLGRLLDSVRGDRSKTWAEADAAMQGAA